MAEAGGDALSRLSWALRRYFWVVGIGTAFALVVAAGGSAAFAPREPGTAYQARALVVARTLEVRTDQLPRLATAVFRSTAVAESAVERGALPYDPEDLVPEHAEIDPVQDNVVVFVDGTAHDPALAARVANAAAEALVEELNELGTGIGTFAIQQRAAVPTRPVSEPAIPLPLVAGMAAGPLLALGLIVLLTIVRQPVVHPGEAEALVGAPAVRVRLPRSRQRQENPARVIGLSALVKAVFPEHRGMVVLLACRADRQVPALVSLIAQVLKRYGPVQTVSGSSAEELRELERQAMSDGGGPAWSQAPVVVEGPALADWDVPQFLPPTARAVLVVPHGVPRSALRSAVDQLAPREVAVTAIVTTSRRQRRRRTRSSSGDASATLALTSGEGSGVDQQPDSEDGVNDPGHGAGDDRSGGDVSNDPSSDEATRR